MVVWVVLAACDRGADPEPPPIDGGPAGASLRCVGTGERTVRGVPWATVTQRRDPELRPVSEEVVSDEVRSATRWSWDGPLLLGLWAEVDGTVVEWTDHRYDAAGRRVESFFRSYRETPFEGPVRTAWTYDAEGHEVLEERFGADGALEARTEQLWEDGRVVEIRHVGADGGRTVTRTYPSPAPDPDYVEEGELVGWVSLDGVPTVGSGRVEVLHDAEGNEVSRDTITAEGLVRSRTQAWADGRLVERAQTELGGTGRWESWAVDARGLPVADAILDTSPLYAQDTRTTWTWDCP